MNDRRELEQEGEVEGKAKTKPKRDGDKGGKARRPTDKDRPARGAAARREIPKEQLAAVGGILAVVLLAVATFVAGSPPRANADPTTISSFFFEKRGRIQFGAFATGIAAASLMWFLAGLWSRLRRRNHDTVTPAAAALIGGVAATALLLTGEMAYLALSYRSGAPTAGALFDLGNLSHAAVGFPVAVLAVGTGVAASRGATLPGWIVRASYWAAPIALVRTFAIFSQEGSFRTNGPISYITFAAIAIWIILVSVGLMRRAPERGPRRDDDDEDEDED
jgi:hypothetical protein